MNRQTNMVTTKGVNLTITILMINQTEMTIYNTKQALKIQTTRMTNLGKFKRSSDKLKIMKIETKLEVRVGNTMPDFMQAMIKMKIWKTVTIVVQIDTLQAMIKMKIWKTVTIVVQIDTKSMEIKGFRSLTVKITAIVIEVNILLNQI
uniref:Uncharacterized protein n=1 Tax=Cacopsylla melanoneura TaxID=428564 RepID=A0A8D9E683_9HEMI